MAKKKRYPVSHEEAIEITSGGTLKTRLANLDTEIAKKAASNSPTLTGTPKSTTAAVNTNNTQIATTAFVHTLVESKIATADAMIYKGTIGTSGTISSLPTTHSVGWTYKVITAGTYAAQKCEIGDMIVCNTGGTAANDTHWDVIQTNIDGAVTGPFSSVTDRIATFNGTSGKIIKDGGTTLSELVKTTRKVTAGTGLTGGGALSADITLTHQVKPTAGTDAGGTGSVVSGVTIDSMGHVVSTSKTTVTTITGNAGSATKLATARNLSVAAPGVVGTAVSFNGTANVALKFNDSACFDLSGATSDNMTLKTAFENGYWRPQGTVKTLQVNSVIDGPNFDSVLNLIRDYNGKVVLYLGTSGYIPVVFHEISIAGMHVANFTYNNVNYFMAFYKVLSDDGGIVEMLAVKSTGTTSEIPTIPTLTGSWVSLSDLCPKGYAYHDQETNTRYEYNGADWLYEEYVTA